MMAGGPATVRRERLAVSCLIDGTRPLDRNLRSHVVGQDEAIQTLVCAYSRLLSGLRDPSRPVLTALLLGPTGVGKTETARALAETLFGSERAMTRVNCEEYAHGHELSKLLGSPPGYVGHNIEPLLSQDRIDAPHREAGEARATSRHDGLDALDKVFPPEEDRYLSIILFDEIEKAHPIVWNALLGILEDGTLTLGNNSTTDFTRSIIVLTSNVGSREMSEQIERHPLGFRTEGEKPSVPSLKETALSAARGVFPFEFLNRIDEILFYSPLEHQHLEEIFEKFLGDIHARAMNQAGIPLLIRVSPTAKALILERGTDLRFGARPLRRAMESEIVDPLSRLIASGQLEAGDVVDIDKERETLAFYRNRGAVDLGPGAVRAGHSRS